MAKQSTLPELHGEVLMRRLAREIAMDQHELERILKTNNVTPTEFARIARQARFKIILQDELTKWNSATNTGERVKIKASAMVEEWLPEAFAQLHNENATLLHRTQLATLVARLGGMEKGDVSTSLGGERFSVTINLGADARLQFDNELPSKVIEGTANDED